MLYINVHSRDSAELELSEELAEWRRRSATWFNSVLGASSPSRINSYSRFWIASGTSNASSVMTAKAHWQTSVSREKESCFVRTTFTGKRLAIGSKSLNRLLIFSPVKLCPGQFNLIARNCTCSKRAFSCWKFQAVRDQMRWLLSGDLAKRYGSESQTPSVSR